MIFIYVYILEFGKAQGLGNKIIFNNYKARRHDKKINK